MTRRLIDANAYLAKMRPKGISDELWEECGTYKSVINEPTVDAEPVRHGKWIDKNTPMHLHSPWNRWKCSVCGECYECSDNFKYCPHCGAKMDGEGE